MPTTAPTAAPTNNGDIYDSTFFDDNDMKGWSCGAITACGGLGKICGGYGTKGRGESIEKTFTDLSAGKYILSLDFIKIDGWAWERAYVHINGQQAWSQSGLAYYSGSGQCGQSSSWDAGPPYSFAFPIQSWNEKTYNTGDLFFTTSGAASNATVVISTSLSGPGSNIKSFAVDNILLKKLPPSAPLELVTFDNNDMDGWSCSAVTRCGAFGKICGGYNTKGGGPGNLTAKEPNQIIQREITGLEAGAYSISLDFIKIDSWDNEKAFVYINGEEKWSKSGIWYKGTPQCGQIGPWMVGQYWKEESWNTGNLTFSVESPLDFTTIIVTTSLNEAANRESFGIDNVTSQFNFGV